MHRIGPELAIEIPGGHGLRSERPDLQSLGETVRRIIGEQQPFHFAVRVAERRINGMDAPDEHSVLIHRPGATLPVGPVIGPMAVNGTVRLTVWLAVWAIGTLASVVTALR